MIISQFPDSQTLTMQQEALKRVRDMQMRARQSVDQTNASPEPFTHPPAFSQPSGPSAQTQPQQQYQAQSASFGAQQQFQQQASFGRPPHPNMPPQNNMQQGTPQQNMPPQINMQQGPPQQNMPPQNSMQQGTPQQSMPPQNSMQSGPQRQSGFSQPNNILSHLFGGGRQSGPQNQGSTGGQRGNAQGMNQNAPRSGGSGLLDLLRKQGLGDSVSGLGETLQNTISSVSEPLSNLMESFGIDGEKLIILLVMWAIFNEHKDNKMLLMALGYLLL
ncbi:MAG: hypothetical protein VB035_13560 [Candidatus Fimivivens sp.]|nr:hypothetical protein [Candidatus Fimivivens sp.]